MEEKETLQIQIKELSNLIHHSKGKKCLTYALRQEALIKKLNKIR
jgi:hypothetical protein